MSKATTHADYFDGWQTPPEWLDWAERTLGGPLFDPCPATWTPEQPSGLEIDWQDRAYVNHPGDRLGRAKHAWWRKHIAELRAHPDRAAIWCLFSDEQARHLRPSPLELPGWLVVPHERLAYWRDGKPVTAPSSWSWFWCYGRAPEATPRESWIVPTGRGHVALMLRHRRVA